MSQRLKSKSTSCGFVEVKQNGMTYELWVDGVLKQYSASLDYILSEYDKLR